MLENAFDQKCEGVSCELASDTWEASGETDREQELIRAWPSIIQMAEN